MGIESGMALQGAGVAAQTFGAYKSAAGQKAALGYQAAVASNNQQIAQDQQRIAMVNGQQQEAASELKTASLMGEQRATMAANGVDLGTGSANEVLATSKLMGGADALTIRDNAARQAWAYGEQAKGYGAEAAMDRSTADAVSPFNSAFGTLLSGAGTVASSWYKYNKTISGKGA